MRVNDDVLIDVIKNDLCTAWNIRVTQDLDEYEDLWGGNNLFNFTSPLNVGRKWRGNSSDGPSSGYPQINVVDGALYWPKHARGRHRVWVMVHELAHLLATDESPTHTDEEYNEMPAFERRIAMYLEMKLKLLKDKLVDQWQAWRCNSGSARVHLEATAKQWHEEMDESFFAKDGHPLIRAWMPGETLSGILEDLGRWREGTL